MRKMKDSGIEWIGQIPEDWNVIRTKYLCDLYTGNSIKDEDKDNFKDPIDAHPYIATKDIDVQFCTADYDNGIYIKNKDSSFKIAPTGSALMCIEGGSAGKKKALVTQQVSFVNKLCCFSAVSANNRFVYYYISSPHYEEQFKTSMSGLIGGVSVSVLKNFPISIPDLNIQSHIADFLDDKCGKIDRYIEKQRKIIEKLKEYKQAVITEAVLPKDGWIKCHLGYLAKFKNGLNYEGLSTDSEIKFLGVGDFQNHFVLDSVDMFSTLKFDGNMPSDLLLQNGDIVFVRSNGSKELVGRSVLIDKIDYPLTYSGFCIRMRNYRQDIVLNTFLLYRFWSNEFRQNLNRDSRGSNINNLNQELLAKLTVAFPSINEQMQIVASLDKKCSEIDTAISRKQSVIDKLTEYKKSLIYETVTGKLEV